MPVDWLVLLWPGPRQPERAMANDERPNDEGNPKAELLEAEKWGRTGVAFAH
jgi:hypothetical protein